MNNNLVYMLYYHKVWYYSNKELMLVTTDYNTLLNVIREKIKEGILHYGNINSSIEKQLKLLDMELDIDIKDGKKLNNMLQDGDIEVVENGKILL